MRMQKGYKIQKFRKGASVFGCNTISCAMRNYLCNFFMQLSKSIIYCQLGLLLMIAIFETKNSSKQIRKC